MKKRNMIMAICAVIAMGLAMPLSAQNASLGGGGVGVGSLQSNMYVATAGIFSNDVDNFVNYHKYSPILKDAKWFAFATGKNQIAGANIGALDAGYARNFGSIYFGVWFRGNVFRSTNGIYETNTSTPQYNAANVLTQTTDTTAYTAQYYETTNNFEFLIGVAGHGIKVGLFESTSSNKNDGSPARNVTVTDNQNGVKTYTNEIDEYDRSQSYIRPYLGWGTNLPIAGMNIRPYADIGFGIYSDTLIDNYRSYTKTNGVNGNATNVVGAGYNNGYLQPNFKLGAWLDLAKKDTVQQSVGLSYAFSTQIYDNDADGLGSVDGTVRWNAGYINRVTQYVDRTETETNMTYIVNDQTNRPYQPSTSHTITPAYKITGEPAENFKVGFSAEIPITFSSNLNESYTANIEKQVIRYNNGTTYARDYNLINYNDDREISTFGFNLNLNVGASYQLIPKRFGINAGISASPVRYSSTDTKTTRGITGSIETTVETQTDGTVTKTNNVTLNADRGRSAEEKNSVWQQYTATLRGGFTFNFNEHFTLDMAASSGNFPANEFNLDLTYVNIIFTVKY